MAEETRHTGPILTLVVVAIVGAAVIAQNLRLRGPSFIRQPVLNYVLQVETLSRGWPFNYYEANSISEVRCSFGSPYRPAPPITQQSTPERQLSDPQTLCLLADIFLGILMLIGTAIVTEYWRRYRKGPFQFGLRSMVIVTTLAGIIVALIDNNLTDWSIILSPPLALGIISLPATVGLALDASIRQSDRRLSAMRR